METDHSLKYFLKTALQGLFWLLPTVIIIVLVLWMYNKIDGLVDWLFRSIGFTPDGNGFFWMILVLIVFLFILYIVGHLVKTKFASHIDGLLEKIPGYKTVKDLIGIFNSSKEGANRVLVVAIRGFANEGYNIGLMYSQKESILKDHYTITLSMSPIPNGGYMFEVHKDNILVIEDATFDNNLQYLLSMGVKSFAEILNTKPQDLSSLTTLTTWLKREKKKATDD